MKCFIAITCLLFSTICFEGKEPLELEEILVTGTKLNIGNPFLISVDTTETGRLCIEDALLSVSETDIQQRGAFGMQADYAIRGSTFQQTAVLLDGIKINDSQTAHFNCDIPAPFLLLQNINILTGQGSAIYGSAAMCGTFDIKTKTAENDLFFLKSYASSYNTFYSGGTLSLALPKSYLLLSADGSSSDGYSYDTDFRRYAAAVKAGFRQAEFSSDIYAGYTEKDFGAYDFYTPGKNKPSREKTGSFLISSSNKIFLQKDTANISLSYKRHLDDFILTLLDPSAYRNLHILNDVKLGLSYAPFFENGIKTVLGSSYGLSSLDSSSLGKKQEEYPGIFLETFFPLTDKYSLNAAVLLESRKQLCETAESLGFSFKPDNTTDIKLSAGRSFRFPSFTELYYTDPFNIGNDNLAAEKVYSVELGIVSKLCTEVKGSLSLFYRYQKDLIDWVAESGLWKVQNIGTSEFYGSSAAFDLKVNEDNGATISYSFTRAITGTIYESKYALNFPEHKLNININIMLPFETTLNLPALIIIRNTTGNYETLSLTISRKIDNTKITLGINNVFNRQYQDIAGVTQPGRTLFFGAEMYFK
ncbi:MAG: TonB-dependent receptor [Candidatus Firestonebacteria bacterium]